MARCVDLLTDGMAVLFVARATDLLTDGMVDLSEMSTCGQMCRLVDRWNGRFCLLTELSTC